MCRALNVFFNITKGRWHVSSIGRVPQKLDMVGHTCNLITREVEGGSVILEVVFGHITSLSRDREGNGERGGRGGERFLLNFLAPSLTLSSQ